MTFCTIFLIAKLATLATLNSLSSLSRARSSQLTVFSLLRLAHSALDDKIRHSYALTHIHTLNILNVRPGGLATNNPKSQA